MGYENGSDPQMDVRKLKHVQTMQLILLRRRAAHRCVTRDRSRDMAEEPAEIDEVKSDDDEEEDEEDTAVVGVEGVAAAAAAGLRSGLRAAAGLATRSPARAGAAIVALAKEQKHAHCAAVLREVASAFGYTLHLSFGNDERDDDGDGVEARDGGTGGGSSVMRGVLFDDRSVGGVAAACGEGAASKGAGIVAEETVRAGSKRKASSSIRDVAAAATARKAAPVTRVSRPGRLTKAEAAAAAAATLAPKRAAFRAAGARIGLIAGAAAGVAAVQAAAAAGRLTDSPQGVSAVGSAGRTRSGGGPTPRTPKGRWLAAPGAGLVELAASSGGGARGGRKKPRVE